MEATPERFSRKVLLSVPSVLICVIVLLSLAGCAAKDRLSPTPIAAPETNAWATFNRAGVLDQAVSGLADRADGRAVRIDDPVRIASVSKLVVALVVMRMVEGGGFDLDADVSDTLGWQLRNPAFPQTRLTMRMLLSHTSSVKDEGESYVVPPSSTVQAVVANGSVYDEEHAPGTFFRYANFNYVLVATVLESASGERFDELAQKWVLRPLGLKACFGWTSCERNTVMHGVTLYAADGSVRKDGKAERFEDCPVRDTTSECVLKGYIPGSNGAVFSPQGGLRISVLDLTVLGRLFLNQGHHAETVFLTPNSIQVLVGPDWVYDGSNGNTSGGFFCSYGMGVQTLRPKTTLCGDTLFDDRRTVIGHPGEAYGLLSGLWIDTRKGAGIAYFSANDYRQGTEEASLFRSIERTLAGHISQ